MVEFDIEGKVKLYLDPEIPFNFDKFKEVFNSFIKQDEFFKECFNEDIEHIKSRNLDPKVEKEKLNLLIDDYDAILELELEDKLELDTDGKYYMTFDYRNSYEPEVEFDIEHAGDSFYLDEFYILNEPVNIESAIENVFQNFDEKLDMSAWKWTNSDVSYPSDEAIYEAYSDEYESNCRDY